MDPRCNALYKTLASCPIKVPQVTQLTKLHTTQIASKYFFYLTTHYLSLFASRSYVINCFMIGNFIDKKAVMC